jgi:tetratricopeptide (TPR) repeat protein
MPFERNSRFTGRELELSKLENIISSNNQTIKVAITGLGGVGKTQLAIELVYRVIENYEDCSVFWIPAMDLESLHQAYLAIAQKLNVPGIDKGKDSIDVKSLVQEYLSKESAGRWLLVFDNADDVDLWLNRSASKQDSNRLVDYLPRSTQGSIIFTTRDRKAAVKLAPRHIIEVLEMDKAAAKELLQKCLINPDLTLIDHGTQVDRNVEALLAQLTYLPLAIVQASAYINENGISITDYLSLLAEKDETIIELLSEDFEEDSRYPHIKNPVAITWLISFEQIKQRDNLAAEYLSFMSCVEPKDIPESLLPAGPSRKKEIDAIGTLHAYSFVTRRPASSCLDLHRLVHLATRNWLSENDQMVEWNSKTMRRLVEIFPENEHKNRSLWRAYLPHAICALRKNAGNNDEDRAKLSHKVGLCLLDEGRFDEAESLLVKVKDIREKMLGAEHPRTLISISDLALLLLNQARFEEAEEMNRLALERYEKVFGVGHPDTLISMSNLAVVLRQQGKLKASEELNRRALEEKEKLLGVDHLETLTSVNNLAFNLQKQGKYEAAEQLNRRALKVREKVLGLDHPETLTSVNNLAFNLQRQGKYEAAEKLNRQAFEMREKVLGADHPDTLISMGNLALALQNRGELEAAEELSRKALEGKERLLGLDHPETLTTVNNLSIVLGQRGMLDAAEKMNRRAIEGREKVLGPQHQDTLTSVSNLAVVLQYQGNVEAAEEMNRRALEGREKALGSEHPETLGSMYSLAYLLHQRKEYGPACSLYERACQGFEISLGHDHPRTKSCRNDYLNAKKESGKG